MNKKLLLPESISYCGASANWMQFDSLQNAVEMCLFCQENGIKYNLAIEKDFPKNEKYVITVDMKNANVCPYRLECYHETEDGFDGVIVTIIKLSSVKIKCVHYEDKEYETIVENNPICRSNFFYLHGEIEEWCSEHFGGIADKCSIYNTLDLPHHTVTADKDYLLCDLEGEYEVELHNCPHKLVGFFYTKQYESYINKYSKPVIWTELRGLIVKADNQHDVEFARNKMLTRSEIL